MIKRDKTDKLYSEYIRLLCDGICSRCHKRLGVKSRGLHCAHCFSRGKRSVRFDRDNATALCYGCHRFIDSSRLIKEEFFRELLGNERFDALILRAHKPIKLDIEAIQKDLKAKINTLQQPSTKLKGGLKYG